MNTPPGCSQDFDNGFDQIPGLTWQPWVGSQWAQRPAERRLLVVGESHYALGTTSEEIARNIETCSKHRSYTREVVSESLVEDDWATPTLRNIPKMLFGAKTLDRLRFWSEVGYYNFVQRQMNGPDGERPTGDDFLDGWPVFLHIVELLQPSFCLFIGVEATNSFWHGLQKAGWEPFWPERRSKVSRTWGRHAVLEVGGKKVELVFVQHAGRYFSWQGWNEHLQREHPALMEWLRDERYAVE